MIDMQMSSEQEQIVDSIRSMLTDTLPYARFVPKPSPVRNEDSAQFAQMGEMGLFGIGLAQDQGGVGYTLVEEVLVARELGRNLVSPSAIAMMIAVHVAATAGDSALAAQLMTGTTPVGLAIPLRYNVAQPAGDHYLVEAEGSEWTLLWNAGGMALVPEADWGDRRAVPPIDSTVALERATLATSANGLKVSADAGLDRRAQLLVSAYLTGMAEAAVDDTLDYVKVREQFNQPIGAFQAVKHRCADMLARSTVAWNITIFAALTELAGGKDAEFQVTASRILANDAAFKNAAVNILNHGAYGFTGEHHAHLFVKRSHLFELMGGDTHFQKARMLSATAPSHETT